MTPEQFKKAKPLIGIIKDLEVALDQCEKAIQREITKDEKNADTQIENPNFNDGMRGGYQFTVCEYSDGSGWKIDMSGTWSALEFLNVTKNFIQSQLDTRRNELAEI